MGILAERRARRVELQAAQSDASRERNMRLAAEASMAYSDERWMELVGQLAEGGWMHQGDDGLDFTEDGRRTAVMLSRWLAIKNPLIRRRVRVQVAYVFGQGVEVVAADDEVNDVVRSFMDDHRNRRVLTSPEAMQEREHDLQTDGNLYFALFTNRMNGRVIVRTLPSTKVTDIVTNPQDRQEPWYYLYRWTERTSEGTVERRHAYPDLQYLRTLEFDLKRVPAVIGVGGTEWEVQGRQGAEVGIIHVKVGGMTEAKFGHPETYSMNDWAKAYVSWLEDWSSVAKSLARFAWNVTTSGKVSKATEKLASKLSTTAEDTNPPAIPGSAFVANPDGTAATPIPKTGANVSSEDGIQLRKMAAAGSDFPDTIIGGDPDQGNLATAKTLDRPTELSMRLRQGLWGSVLGTIADQVVIAAAQANELLAARVTNDDGNMTVELPNASGGEERSATVNITFPPIIEPDVAGDAGAVVAAAPKLPPRIVTELLLSIFGIDDQDEILAIMFPDDNDPLGITAQREQAAAIAGAMPSPDQPTEALRGAEEDFNREAARLRAMIEAKA